MDQDDPEKRIADLEHQFAEEKRGADLRPARRDGDMAFPSQTPNYQHRQLKKRIRIVVIAFAGIIVLVAGIMILADGTDREDDAFVWLGATLIFLSLLIPVIPVIRYLVTIKKEKRLHEPGTIQLLTVESSLRLSSGTSNTGRGMDQHFFLKAEMQIHLDSGPTCRGSYQGAVSPFHMREWWLHAHPPARGRLQRHINSREALDAWFHVGASVRCLYNPADPDNVVAYPFAAAGDQLTYREFVTPPTGRVFFESAT